MNYPHIAAVAALTSLGGDWPSTWQALREGRTAITGSAAQGVFKAADFPVSAVCSLGRGVDQAGDGPCASLFGALLRQLHGISGARVYASSNHGESDLLRSFLDGLSTAQAEALLGEPLAHTVRGRARFTYAACAGGLHAAVHAALDCADGMSGDAIVVAADALSVIETVGFARAGALGKQGARPFGADRDGLLIGEGGAALVLSAGAASPHAIHMLGVGMSCDGFHPTDPDPAGTALERSVRMCLADAGLAPGQVAAVIAHGTGTRKGDAIELEVLQRVWAGAPLLVTSVKGQVGHLMGAAGLFNLLVGYEASRSGLVPPTAGSNSDASATEVVTGKCATIVPGGPVLCLASGFGGNNVAVLLGRRNR